MLLTSQKLTHAEALKQAIPQLSKASSLKKRKSELTRTGFRGLEKTFQGIGLPIVPMEEPPPLAEQEDVHRRLALLSAIRNIIEHNRSVANAEFVALVPDCGYQIGDPVSITVTELGYALSAVEFAADSLNG